MIKSDDLKQVRIGCFKGFMDGGHITRSNGVLKNVVNVELNVDSISHITCIIDEERKVAIDIFTGDCYPMLERDDCDRIVEPAEGIIFNMYYALNIEKENILGKSQLYSIYLKYMANRASLEYEKSDKNIGIKTYRKEK